MLRKKDKKDKSVEDTAKTMSNALLGMGVLHFVKPEPFDAIVPDYVPMTKRQATYWSGVAELVTGALLRVDKTRTLGGYSAMALFLAVFPANIEMARQWAGGSTVKKVIAFGRLPLQFPMIAQAWKVARHK
ncbi:hypothetical protein KRX51_00685 [Corynebacterium sp. TAE3-ERU12]|nr:hypothetical protein [Corynebacterium sp. TAE3-ERU12]